MSKIALYVTFVDNKKASYCEVSQEQVDQLTRTPECLPGLDDLIFDADVDEYVVISDSLQRACYIALTKVIEDNSQFWTLDANGNYFQYMKALNEQIIDVLLNVKLEDIDRMTIIIDDICN